MVNEKQLPVMNIGIVGHVDHGKTTLTQMLTGKFTDEHSEELKRGISIRLGYADLSIKRCPKCNTYTTFDICFNDNTKTDLIRTYSIIDAPGHETLIATVLTGTALIDAAILVIAANEPCPQPQTEEHLIALEIAGIKNIIIVQNKIDLVSKEEAKRNYQQIKEFVRGTIAENSPVIPISAHHNANIDILLKAIAELFVPPERDETVDPVMYVARSFDVNKPGTKVEDLVGGVLGGAIRQGVFRVGDEVKILPGLRKGDKYIEVKTRISSMKQLNKSIEEAHPGGLIAISTSIDPYFTKADGMVGSVIVKEGKDKDVNIYNELKLRYVLIERIIDSKRQKIIEDIPLNSPVLLNVGTARTIGVVVNKTKDIIDIKLKLPIAAFKNDRVVISMQINGRWRLVGYGDIL